MAVTNRKNHCDAGRRISLGKILDLESTFMSVRNRSAGQHVFHEGGKERKR